MAETTHFQVFTYYANLIGYSRFIFLMMSPYWAFADNWLLCGVCYGLSYLLDCFDGYTARLYNQSSRFGAALDQVCDRASNATCYMILAQIFPKVTFLFYLCFLLDFGSHWFQFQSTAYLGSSTHKGGNAKENWMVSIYYNNGTVFSTVCVGAEVATCFLFWLGKQPSLYDNMPFCILTGILTSIMAFKMFVNVHQWIGAADRFAENQHIAD